jgi:anti-anti-sigma factor
MDIALLEHKHAEIVTALIDRIHGRSASVFRRAGEQVSRRYAEAGIRALESDLAAGKLDGARDLSYLLIDELGDDGLTFADLRLFALGLRREIRAALAGSDDLAELRARVEEWFFELLLIATMRFMAWRDEVTRRDSAKQSITRLESQLAELGQALEEKTTLLEVIRQASTPIVPVVPGVLVVPLVGTFDVFRAELVTERLLHEVGRLRARTAILDVSGVPVFDTHAAQLIMRLARTVRLLGTRVFLVGMSPMTARTIVGLGVDLGAIESFASLQDGLAHALALQNMTITAVG